MENGTTAGAAAGSRPADGAAAAAWSGAVDAGLVSRLQRPARQPGVVRLGYARALLARHRAMAPGVPLAEVLLRRLPDERERAETPVVAGRPVAAPDSAGTGAGAAAPPRADVRTPIVVRPPAAPLPMAQPAADPRDTTVHATPPGGWSAGAPGGPRRAAGRPPASLGGEAVEASSGAVAGPAPRVAAPAQAGPVTAPAQAEPVTAPQVVSPPPALPAVRPAPAVPPDVPGSLVPATLHPGTPPTDPPAPVRPAAAPPTGPRLPDERPVVVATRPRPHAVRAGAAGEPGTTPPVVRPVGPGARAVDGSRPVPPGAGAAAADPGRSAPRPIVVRPDAAGPDLAEEVHRLVVRELTRSAAPPVPALTLPVPPAAPAPVAAPPPQRRADAPTTRADRVAERPRRSPPPVDIGRVADAVARRLAHRGAVERERRGMNR